MKTLAAVLAVLAVSACNKGPSLEQLQKDGYQCSREGQSGASFSASATNHCFSCADDSSMTKCGSNPLTSGCKEVPCTKK